MTGTYTTREGDSWPVRNMTPHRFLPGFWFGERSDTGQHVCLHEHRLVFEQPLQTACATGCPPLAEVNPS